MVFKELFEKYVFWTQTVFGGLQALGFFVAGAILFGLTASNDQNIRFYFACALKGDYIKIQCIRDYSDVELYPLQNALLVPSISFFGPILIWLFSGITTKILFIKYVKNGTQHPKTSAIKCFVCHIDLWYFIWLAVRLVFFLAMGVYYIFYFHKWDINSEYNCMASHTTTCTYSKAKYRTIINRAYFGFNVVFFVLAFFELVYMILEKYCQQLPADTSPEEMASLKKDSGCIRCKQFSKQHLIFLEDEDSIHENNEHLLSENGRENNTTDFIEVSGVEKRELPESCLNYASSPPGESLESSNVDGSSVQPKKSVIEIEDSKPANAPVQNQEEAHDIPELSEVEVCNDQVDAFVNLQPANQDQVTNQPANQNQVTNQPVNQNPVALQPANQTPLASQHANQTPLAYQPANQTPLASRHANQTRLASQHANQTPLASQHANQTPLASQHANQTPLASQHANQTPLASQHANQTPLASQHANQTPLAYQPANQTPLASQHANQNPLGYQPANQTSLASQHANQNPVAYQPTNQNPLAYQPANQNPLAYQPANQTPLAYQPANQNPSAYQPTNQTPLAYQPANQNPSAYQPANQNPLAYQPANQPGNQNSAVNQPTNQNPLASQPTNQNPVALQPTNQNPFNQNQFYKSHISQMHVNENPIYQNSSNPVNHPLNQNPSNQNHSNHHNFNENHFNESQIDTIHINKNPIYHNSNAVDCTPDNIFNKTQTNKFPGKSTNITVLGGNNAFGDNSTIIIHESKRGISKDSSFVKFPAKARKGEEMSKKVMLEVEREIGKDWRPLGLRLGLTAAILEEIQNNFSTVHDRSYEMLKTWKRRNPEGATLDALVNALFQIDREDIANKLPDS